MPRVVPSQVIDLIDKLFPDAQAVTPNKNFSISRENSVPIAAILRLVEQLPPESLTVGPRQFTEFQASVAALQMLIEDWKLRDFGFAHVRGLRQLNPVVLIRQALAECPDDFPALGTNGLNFIPDDEMKGSLRRDISAANSALSNGEWKAATVLAGSVVEALLLWKLQQQSSSIVSTAVAKVNLKVDSNPINWNLYVYIEVAAELKLIKPDTAAQCRLAKDFRNLIHPGRAQRLGQVCNRATALSAVASVEHVISDLSPLPYDNSGL
jgi:hypothetical protein